MTIHDLKFDYNQPVLVAAPVHKDHIAALFGTAQWFRIWRVREGEAIRTDELFVSKPSGLDRVNLLRKLGVDILICNGIEKKLQLMFEAWGIRVIRGVIGNAQQAVEGFGVGEIAPRNRSERFYDHSLVIYSCDPVRWTTELFKNYGWEVNSPGPINQFPLDLIADKTCPFCDKPVRVAVCCGPHSYHSDREVQEFNRITAGSFDARVFVHRQPGPLIQLGKELGIEMLDPGELEYDLPLTSSSASLPPLSGPIDNHKRLTGIDHLERDN